MAYSRLLGPLALLALPNLALAGPSAENLGAGAASGFIQAVQISGQFRFAPAAKPVFQLAAFSQTSSAVELAPLLNRNLRAGLSANLGGKNVWLSGVFDRGTFDGAKNVFVDPDAYISLLIEGEGAPRIYKVMDLLTSPQTLTIGGGQFKLKLSPDLTDNFASEIIVINLSNNHKDRITLRDLLNAVVAAGAPVALAGQDYKVFYYDEIKSGRMDPASRLFVFSTTDSGGQPHFFNVPTDSVPSGRISSFQTLDGKPFGLQRDGDKLLIFNRP